MGDNKKRRQRLESLEARLVEHYVKRDLEQRTSLPDKGLIHYWDKEIRGRLKEINRLRKKLRMPERTE